LNGSISLKDSGITLEEQFAYFASHGAVYIYIFLFLSSVIENLFPPFPGDMFTLVGAYFAVSGKLSFVMAFAAVNFGGLAGASVLYFLGRTKGRQFFISSVWIGEIADKLSRMEKWVDKYGGWIILGGRFFSGVRSLISVAAGIINIDVRKFVVLTLLGFIIWNGILMGAVFLMRDKIDNIGTFISMYSKVILIAISVAITAYILNIYLKYRKGRS